MKQTVCSTSVVVPGPIAMSALPSMEAADLPESEHCSKAHPSRATLAATRHSRPSTMPPLHPVEHLSTRQGSRTRSKAAKPDLAGIPAGQLALMGLQGAVLDWKTGVAPGDECTEEAQRKLLECQAARLKAGASLHQSPTAFSDMLFPHLAQYPGSGMPTVARAATPPGSLGRSSVQDSAWQTSEGEPEPKKDSRRIRRTKNTDRNVLKWNVHRLSGSQPGAVKAADSTSTGAHMSLAQVFLQALCLSRTHFAVSFLSAHVATWDWSVPD